LAPRRSLPSMSSQGDDLETKTDYTGTEAEQTSVKIQEGTHLLINVTDLEGQMKIIDVDPTDPVHASIVKKLDLGSKSEYIQVHFAGETLKRGVTFEEEGILGNANLSVTETPPPPPPAYQGEAEPLLPPKEPKAEPFGHDGSKGAGAVLGIFFLFCICIAFAITYTIGTFASGYYFREDGWYMLFVFIPAPCVVAGCLMGVNMKLSGGRNGEVTMAAGAGCVGVALFIAAFTGLALGVHAGNINQETGRVLSGGLGKDWCPSNANNPHSTVWWAPNTYYPANTYGEYNFEYSCNCGKYGCDICSWCIDVVPVMTSGATNCAASKKVAYWAFRGKQSDNSHDCRMPPMRKGATIVSDGTDGKFYPPVCSGSDDDARLEDYEGGNEGALNGLLRAKQDFLRRYHDYSDAKNSKFVYMCDTPYRSAQEASDAPEMNLLYHMIGVWILLLPACCCFWYGFGKVFTR